MKFGLEQNIIDNFSDIFSKYSQIEKVLIFGSRAKGNYTEVSDIDLAFFGDKLTQSIIGDVLLNIEELYLPYKTDAQLFTGIKNAALTEHIERTGVIFYIRCSSPSPTPEY